MLSKWPRGLACLSTPNVAWQSRPFFGGKRTLQQPITLTINGEQHALLVEAHWSLLDTLRDHLHLTGTKKGCDEGDCDACTVLLQEHTATSCMVLALDARDQEIVTVEGLAQGEKFHS